MAKSIIEDLLGMMTPEEQKLVRAKIDANPTLAVRDKKQSELFSIYTGEEEGTPAATTTTTTVPAATPHVPTVPSAAATTAAPSTPAAGGDSNSQILAELTSLKTSITAQVEDIKKNYIPTADLAKHRTELLALAIKTAEDINDIRATFKEEFPDKKWDHEAYRKFVEDSKLPNGAQRYATLRDAYDAFVAKDRTAAEIAKGIRDGVKQATSAATVPGQTTSTALSPAQAEMAKARAKGATEGKTSAQAAAERLAALVRARDEGSMASA